MFCKIDGNIAVSLLSHHCDNKINSQGHFHYQKQNYFQNFDLIIFHIGFCCKFYLNFQRIIPTPTFRDLLHQKPRPNFLHQKHQLLLTLALKLNSQRWVTDFRLLYKRCTISNIQYSYSYLDDYLVGYE